MPSYSQQAKWNVRIGQMLVLCFYFCLLKCKNSVVHMDSQNIVDMGLSQMSSPVIGHNLDAELDVLSISL